MAIRLSARLRRPFGTSSSPNERLAIAIAVGAMGTLGFSVSSPILPDLADHFGVSRGAIGLVQASVSIAGVLFSTTIGYMADRRGRRWVILWALALFSICGVAGFFARSFWVLVVVRFGQGLGTSGILGVGIVLIGDIFTGEQRTRAMGINLTGLQAVSMMGPIVAGVLAVGGAFRPFLIFLVGLPLAAWASRMPDDRPAQSVERALGHVRSAWAAMHRQETLINFVGLLVATFVATYLLHGLGFTVTPLLLADEFGTSVTVRGLIIAMFQAGVILAAIRIGVILKRLGLRRTVTLSFAIMALGGATAAWAPNALMVGVGLTASGVGFGLFIPQAQSYAAAVGGTRYRGMTVLSWVTVVRISQMLGPPTGSFTYDAIGATAPFLLGAAATAVIALAWDPMQRALSRGGPAPGGLSGGVT